MKIEETSLHDPMRSEFLMSLEDHLNYSAKLSRAIWLLVEFCELDLSDCRNIEAISALAHLNADHASAARHCYQRQASFA